MLPCSNLETLIYLNKWHSNLTIYFHFESSKPLRVGGVEILSIDVWVSVRVYVYQNEEGKKTHGNIENTHSVRSYKVFIALMLLMMSIYSAVHTAMWLHKHLPFSKMYECWLTQWKVLVFVCAAHRHNKTFPLNNVYLFRENICWYKFIFGAVSILHRC